MSGKPSLAICTALLSLGLSGAAAAQDAAETAVILSGVGQGQGGAARSLGSSISQSINAAADAVRSSRNPDYTGGGYGDGRRRAGGAHVAPAIPQDVDALAGTNAPTYKLGNGSSIRVSGRLIQAPETTCVKLCTESPVP